jgi:type I restriction enzyme S subunit
MSWPSYLEYQDSGTAWLAQLPSNWGIQRLGSLFSERKTTVSDQDFQPLSVTKDGIVPQVETAAKTDNGDNRKLVKAGDFVINSRSDRKGSAGISSLDGSVSVIATVLEPRGLLGRYSHYLLRSQAFQEEYYRFGTGIVADLWSTRYSAMKMISLPVPAGREQTAIADFLDHETAKIDSLIAKQEQLIATLRDDRTATITHAVTEGLDRGVKVKDSGVEWLGEIPNHWVASRLKNIIQSTESGTSVNAGDWPAGADDIGVLKTSCVSAGWFNPEANKTVVDPAAIDRATCPVRADSLVVNRANTPLLVGSTGYAENGYNNLFLSDKLWQVRFNGALAQFVYYWTQTEVYRSQIAALCVGASSSMQNLAMADFRNIAVAVPPVDEQRAIVDFLSDRTAMVDRLTTKAAEVIDTLCEYGSALITSAVTGKIDVRGAA